MYLDNSKEYQTVWQLAHNWTGLDQTKSDPNVLSVDLKEMIHRLMHAAFNQAIVIRTRRRAFFIDESFLSNVFDFSHVRKFLNCLRHDEFNMKYLDSIYVKRGDVLRWCQNEFFSPPSIWKVVQLTDSNVSEDDANAQWCKRLTDRQRRVITCLEIAKHLWLENSNLSYEEVYNHSLMMQLDNPRAFTSLESFKTWTREFAPKAAKMQGRRK